jgi:predicted PurR-regulated permease PerM
MRGPQVQTGTSWLLPRGLIVLLGLTGLVVTVTGIRAFSGIVGPVFLALMLTVAVHPLREWLRRRDYRDGSQPCWRSSRSTEFS